jgi:molybdate transport system regulatory protein
MDRELRVVLSARVFSDQKCFGPGVSQLLKRVDELHSLRAAALSMSMAYSKAWTVVRNAEDGLGFKLLASNIGGRNGGGAALTDEARQVMRAYDEYCAKLRAYGETLFEQTFAFYDALPKQELHRKEKQHGG